MAGGGQLYIVSLSPHDSLSPYDSLRLRVTHCLRNREPQIVNFRPLYCVLHCVLCTVYCGCRSPTAS